MAGSRRSDTWFRDPDMYGFVRRAFAKSMGYDDQDLARPIIGIVLFLLTTITLKRNMAPA